MRNYEKGRQKWLNTRLVLESLHDPNLTMISTENRSENQVPSNDNNSVNNKHTRHTRNSTEDTSIRKQRTMSNRTTIKPKRVRAPFSLFREDWEDKLKEIFPGTLSLYH